MGFNMDEFLGNFDKEFSDTLKNTAIEKPAEFEQVAPGKYAAQIVGMTWKELRAKVPDGFSGMGMSIRMRILATHTGGDTPHAGWYETPVYWFLRKWPARDIPEVVLNTSTVQLFAKMMGRCGFTVPAGSLAGMKDWNDPVGGSIEIQIKKEVKGDREYRNVYLNAPSKIEGTFGVETWDAFSESWVAPASASGLEDIPF